MTIENEGPTITAATPSCDPPLFRDRMVAQSPGVLVLPPRPRLWLGGSIASAMIAALFLVPFVWALQQPEEGAFESAAFTKIREALSLKHAAVHADPSTIYFAWQNEESQAPWSAEEFVTHVVGLPARVVHIRYDVVLLQTQRGTLDMWLCRDGSRTLTWQLGSSMAASSETKLAQHTLLADARGIWSDLALEQTQPWLVLINSSAHAVATLAQAYASLDPTSQHEVNSGIRTWRDELTRARAEEPGRTDIVAQQSCVLSQWASQTICLWEDAGAVLRYEGPRFAVTATAVDFSDDLVQAQSACTPRDDWQLTMTWGGHDGERRSPLASQAITSLDTDMHPLAAPPHDERESFGQAARQSLEALALGNYAPFALLLAGQPLNGLGSEETRERPL